MAPPNLNADALRKDFEPEGAVGLGEHQEQHDRPVPLRHFVQPDLKEGDKEEDDNEGQVMQQRPPINEDNVSFISEHCKEFFFFKLN